MKIKTLVLIMTISLVITACSSNPSMPKQPSKLNRVPVNKTMPVELEG